MKLLGLGSLGLGTGAFHRSPFAMTKVGSAPKRLIIISHNHGWVYDGWKMRPGTVPESASWEVDLKTLSKEQFSPSLAPLFAHRSRLLVPDGLSLSSCALDVEGYRHPKGHVGAWTGNFALINERSDALNVSARSASLDQIIAKKIADVGQFSSLEIGVTGAEPGRNICHADRDLQLPLETSPLALWQRLLGPSQTPSAASSIQKSALDFALSEYEAIEPTLSALDKAKLVTHFDLVRTLETRLEGISHASCGDVKQPQDSLSYLDRQSAFFQLIGTAFSCDLTRVATIAFGDMAPNMFGVDELSEDATHKGIGHNVFADPLAAKRMTDYVAEHAKQVAQLVDLLSSLPDTDGRTIMDNTMIVWGSEMADGWHGYRHYCPLVIGGDWYFRTGRYIHWPHETPVEMLKPPELPDPILITGKPHQHLLVSIANAMGVNTNQVGLSEVQSQNGTFLDLTGPLGGLV